MIAAIKSRLKLKFPSFQVSFIPQRVGEVTAHLAGEGVCKGFAGVEAQLQRRQQGLDNGSKGDRHLFSSLKMG